MALFEDLGFAAGGSAEGLLAAEKIRGQREANEIRRSRLDALTDIESEELARMPSPEQAQESFQIEQDTARAERDIALEEVAETERGNEVANINDRIADTFEGETQGMVDFLAQQGAAFGVDEADGMKTKDWEIFMDHFRSEEGKGLRKEFANIGMNEIKAPLEAITGDLETLRAKHAKTPSSKSLETIGLMEQGIDEMKRSNNAFQSIFNEASEPVEEPEPKRPRELDFSIRAAGLNPDEIDFGTMTEDEAVDVLKKVQEFGKGAAFQSALEELMAISPQKPPGFIKRIFTRLFSNIGGGELPLITEAPTSNDFTDKDQEALNNVLNQ